MSKLTVAIICGGISSEHEISCISAGGVLQGLDRDKYNPILIGITKAGKWVLLPLDYPLEIINGVLPVIDEGSLSVVADIQGFTVNGEELHIDCVFPVLHGPYGEDGTIQGMLEIANLAYVGSGVLASAAAMDKDFAKTIFSAANLKVADGIVIRKNIQTLEIDDLAFPVFVKPARGGSSRGTHKVNSLESLTPAIVDAFHYDNKVMIEQAVIGREIECAVLEVNGVVKASLVGEISIDSKFEFYDFQAKYLDGATTVKIPAEIPEAAAEKIRSQAIKAFKALGCSGLARCDFFYTNEGEVVINEINTMPGFTGTSMYPKLWAATEIGFRSLISALIDTALTRTNSVLGN
jgi:D-alanine-D-alanine ligase